MAPQKQPSNKLKAQCRSFQCPKCDKVCKNSRGLRQHLNSLHPVLSSDDSDNEDELHRFTTHFHPILTGVPVDGEGLPLPAHTKPPVWSELNPENPWLPFEDRLSFDFAHYHFVEVQSSEAKVQKALDLWLAAKIQALKSADCEDVPWSTADDLYATIDNIQQGNAPFKTVPFQYQGSLPENPPAWMIQTYELCVRNSRQVLHHQLATPDFAAAFETRPYRQFQADGDRIWSNMFSGDWVYREADKIAHDIKGLSKGAMLIPVVSGLDKTTVSVATGHQEYHPFYISPGNLTNTARRSHGNGVVPIAFLPIPKVSKREKKTKEYQRFARQLYHTCIAYIFEPLRPGMTVPEIVRCPDGHLRRGIYSIGPVIADYPEQVWLTGIVQGWCPKCRARPENLDNPTAGRRFHELVDAQIAAYDPGILWEQHGLRDNVVPFTHSFPRADIHELIAPDLLHQVIKGTFKDHLVEWVMEYLHHTHGEARALQIINDIDRRISAVPAFPGLRRFEDGRDFAQWTGDDSKALMKVYLAAIVGYVPDKMVQCLSSFLEVCYIFRRNAITATALEQASRELEKFHQPRKIFIETGTRTHCSLPRQHALSHFEPSIIDFGSPNGLCSSITESRHITAVKEPWRRSSRYNALSQMLVTITRLDKIAALRRILQKQGLLQGTTAMAMALLYEEAELVSNDDDTELDKSDGTDIGTNIMFPDDIGPSPGPRLASSVQLCAKPESRYPKSLQELATHLHEPLFPEAFLEYLFAARHPTLGVPPNLSQQIRFSGKIRVFHSAIARFYAPSDACGAGGMQRQVIRCNPSWRGHERRDIVFVAQSDEPGMHGLGVAQLRLLFSFTDASTEKTHACALVNWFNTISDEPDKSTGMWVVEREELNGIRPLQVVSLNAIVRGAHLLPVFGEGRLPERFSYTDALEAFTQYFVNPYIDHHAHELLSD